MKKYKITYQEKGSIKTKVIKSFDIEKEELPLNILKIQKQSFSFEMATKKTISDKKLSEIFYELSLMLESNILFDEALDILIKNQKSKVVKEFLFTIKTSFAKSKNILEELNEYKINHLVKSFLKISQDSGNVPLNIKLLSKFLNESITLKKQFYKVLAYPMLLFISFFFALIAIFNFVIPKFEFMFSQMKVELNFATTSLLFVKDFFENYSLYFLFTCILFVFIIVFLYKKDAKTRAVIDRVKFKYIPFFSSVYRLKTFYIYFLFLDVLLQSKYEFTHCLAKAKVSINNQYLLDRMSQIENLLVSGKNIEQAFSSINLFDELTLNLIRTGEVSNSLEVTIQKINNIHKKRFDDKLKLFSIAIEPIFFLIIMSLIIWIILAIFVPIWSMGDMLKI